MKSSSRFYSSGGKGTLSLAGSAVILFSLLLAGCGGYDDEIEVVQGVLGLANAHAREVDVSEYISVVAAIAPAGYYVNLACGGGSTTPLVVTSPVSALEGGLVRVEAAQQLWTLSVNCDHFGSENVTGLILVEKSLDTEAGTGAASIDGHFNIDGSKECDVALDVTFETTSGQVTSIEGELCGRELRSAASDWIIPGFQGEEFLGG